MAVIREVLQLTHRALEAASIPDARLEAEVMLMAVMQMIRSNLFANQENPVGPQQEQALAAIMQRRLTREPLAYILGRKEFYGISLLMTPNVLIPRPETEQLVEQALFQALMTRESTDLVIADVGTGSGAIAINLAIHLPAARIYAIDKFDSALDVAAYNLRVHNVADRIKLLKGDLLEPLPEPVDLIVANLPYLPTNRLPALQPEIGYEPKTALDGGPDGLDAIRRLLEQAPAKLKPTGGALLELDPEQVPAVRKLARQHFPEAETSVEKDLAGLDRMFVIQQMGE